jgi:5'-nucleotidase
MVMRARWPVAVLAALALLMAACSDSDDEGVDAGSSTTSTTDTGPPSSPEPQRQLQILVTNDDGVAAEGLDVVVEALRSIENVEVTVVAPADQRSGTGGQTTEGELEVTDTELASGYPAKAVDGFPADTVRVAIDEMGLEPDVVVSGINEGQNLGPLVDVSGTVGAARAAVARGVPALAVSSGIADDVDYEAAVPFVLEWVDSHRTVFVEGTAPDEVANMNVPSCATGQVKEPVEVPLATAAEGAVAPSDCESTLTDPPDDITAFNAGYATITDPIPAEPS